MPVFLQGLGEPEHLHVLVNHLPLTGLFAALAALAAALLTRNRVAILTGLALVALFSLSAWPVYVSGENAYDRVYSMADNDGDWYLDRHRDLAERWIWLDGLTGALCVVGMAAGWRSEKRLRRLALAAAVVAAASLVAAAVIADAGGKIRHDEFRSGKPPGNLHRT